MISSPARAFWHSQFGSSLPDFESTAFNSTDVSDVRAITENVYQSKFIELTEACIDGQWGKLEGPCTCQQNRFRSARQTQLQGCFAIVPVLAYSTDISMPVAAILLLALVVVLCLASAQTAKRVATCPCRVARRECLVSCSCALQGDRDARPFAIDGGAALRGETLRVVERKNMPGPYPQRGAVSRRAVEAGTLLVEYLGHVLEEGDQDMYMMTALDEISKEDIEKWGLFQYYLDFWSENLRGDEDTSEDEDEDEEGCCNIADMCNFLTRERFVIDARFIGSVARFINHSCEPNAEAQRWLAADRSVHIIIVALRPIAIGEEVTIDYGWNNEESACHCGAARCRGHL